MFPAKLAVVRLDRPVRAAARGDAHMGWSRETGRPAWTFPDGEYTPVVADRERVYVVGYRRVFAFARRRPS